ncbi:unnamed protein product [Fusarium graminearum]|nr:unnamed protein product [Fusarium graminearum]VTO87351.1 unnamed protein product [Fusarium graminearum]
MQAQHRHRYGDQTSCLWALRCAGRTPDSKFSILNYTFPALWQEGHVRPILPSDWMLCRLQLRQC